MTHILSIYKNIGLLCYLVCPFAIWLDITINSKYYLTNKLFQYLPFPLHMMTVDEHTDIYKNINLAGDSKIWNLKC